MEISGKIIEARRNLGMTQQELAEKINVTERTISNWENGARPSHVNSYQKLSNVFNVSLDYLMRDNIDSKEETQSYLELGRNIAKIADFSSCTDFWMKFAICEKESTLLLPVQPAMKFMNELNQYYKSADKTNYISQLSRDFLFKWHKFNRSNLQLSRTSKTPLLIALERIFTNPTLSSDALPFFPNKPVLLLRDLLINSIKHEEGLDDYHNRITDINSIEMIEFSEEQIRKNGGYINNSLSKYK